MNRSTAPFYLLLILATTSCQLIAATEGELVSSAVPDDSGLPTASSTSQPLTAPRPTAVPDTGWVQLHPGLERRVINLLLESGQILEHIYLLRVDPSLYAFDIGYRPGRPQSLQQWLIEKDALAAVNGGFRLGLKSILL